MLSIIDYSIVFTFLFVSIGVSYILTKKQKNNSYKNYFQSEGKLSWFVAGTGMVATTFAADTPLAVTELVSESGISGNWVWWYGSIGSIVTIYFFAPLWKNSGVTTDLELIQLRYSGIASHILRIFKSWYLGLFMNVIILSWVNLAMVKIARVLIPDISWSFLSISFPELVVVCLILFAFVYTSVMGLSGITYTDMFQFFFAMGGCIWLAFLVLQLPEIGGLKGLVQLTPSNKLNFFPDFSNPSGMTFYQFLTMTTIVWWSSWYPGAEPGGGGYIAQRILATKDIRSSMLSTLWFTIAHYFIRPWPWIIVALAATILFPNLNAIDKGSGYALVILKLDSIGIKGIMLAAFTSAYLSTVATHLNWGASYLTNDFLKPYIIPNKPDKVYIQFSILIQLLSVFLSLYVSFFLLETISGVWKFLLAGSAGMGFVLMARWFWWRVNAWSEIGSMVFPLVYYFIFLYLFKFKTGSVEMILATVGSVVLSIIFITYITNPTDSKTLINFYQTVKPPCYFWKNWLHKNGVVVMESEYSVIRASILSTLGVLLIFSGLFGIGYFLLGDFIRGSISTALFILSFYLTIRVFPK
jgi:solute:Na+ symporter, SSS family